MRPCLRATRRFQGGLTDLMCVAHAPDALVRLHHVTVANIAFHVLRCLYRNFKVNG